MRQLATLAPPLDVRQKQTMGPDTPLKHVRTLGSYDLSMAKWIIARLEEADIRFRVSADDSNIKHMSPTTARYGGNWGAGAKVEILVATGSYDRAKKIEAEYITKYCRV